MSFELLIVAGSLSFLAAALHVGVVIGGPDGIVFSVQGKQWHVMAEKRSLRPTVITLGIASVLIIWGCYAWSGAGLLPSMPFFKISLVRNNNHLLTSRLRRLNCSICH